MKKACPNGRNEPPCKENQIKKIRKYSDKSYTECCYEKKKVLTENILNNKKTKKKMST